jgi:cob(I)alamin adenosyltransferase
MVRLTKIYTRGGDKGETSLVGGQRVSKDDLRIAAIGDVDEANAAIGLARLHTEGETDASLARIQQDIFDLGADIATPIRADHEAGVRLEITSTQVHRLEAEIDRMNAELKPLDSFVLPGGSPASSYLHLARTLVRRAERALVSLGKNEAINPTAREYVNRLSDHLFVLARYLNDKGGADVLWVPGLNRDG